jgi:predicted hydrocarbon binding protein
VHFLTAIGGVQAAREVATGLADYVKMKPKEKAAWWDNAMVRLEKTLGRGKAIEVMASCGRRCCGTQTRKRAIVLRQESSSIADFLQKLNKTGMGGGRLIQKEETIITGGYNKCYCGQVSAAARPFANAIYCQCSRAWLEQYFGSIFERPVSVKMAKTILQGAKSCEFEITLN